MRATLIAHSPAAGNTPIRTTGKRAVKPAERLPVRLADSPARAQSPDWAGSVARVCGVASSPATPGEAAGVTAGSPAASFNYPKASSWEASVERVCGHV